MRSERPPAYPLRLPDKYMEKLRHIAKENSRSVNKEIEMLVKNHVNSFEKEHGDIELRDE